MKLSATLPQDDEGAKVIRFEDVRGQRYTEIFLIGGHVITRHLVGGVYNTIGLNDPTGTGDTSPQAVLDKVDVDALEEEYDLIRAFKNGPRLWTLDWVEVMVGAERDFSGLKARWVMWLDVADGAAGPGAQRGQLSDQGCHGVPGEAGTQVLGPGQDQGPGLVDRLGAFGGGAALGDHEGRMASTAPSRPLDAPRARPDWAARAALTASRGSDLPCRRRSCRSERSTSTTWTPAAVTCRDRPAP